MAANTYAPSGFHEARLWTGSSPNYATNLRQLAWNYSSSIAFGDPVYLNSSGQVVLYAVGGTTIDGIACGFQYFDPNNILSGNFHPAWLAPTLTSSVAVACKVITDPNMVFFAQANGALLTEASVGLNIDIYTGSSGTPVTGSGMSQCALDAGNVHATATLPFRIVGIIGITPGFETPAINSSYTSANTNQWLAVTMNTQDMTTRTGQA
jgi:hypothetical protein